MSRQIDFIFIDDEEINNLICRLTVETTLGKGVRTQSFTNPFDAFDYLVQFKPRPGAKTILFLDINMPVMTGWEFLAAFDRLPAEIKDAIQIYILSSSIDPRDRQRSYANNNVVDFIVKPLELDTINQIVRSIKSEQSLAVVNKA